MTDFSNYKPKEALFSLEQVVDEQFGSVIRTQMKGRGEDLIFMLVKALQASDQEQSKMKEIMMEALAVHATMEMDEKLTVMNGKSRDDIVN